ARDAVERLELEIRVGVEEPGDDLLVLLGREGARRVDEAAAGPHQCRRVVEEVELATGAPGDRRGAPLGPRGLALRKHRLARTRRVQEHTVEDGAEVLDEALGALGGHDRVPDPEPLEVAGQLPRPPPMYVVRDEDALAAEPRGEVRR